MAPRVENNLSTLADEAGIPVLINLTKHVIHNTRGNQVLGLTGY